MTGSQDQPAVQPASGTGLSGAGLDGLVRAAGSAAPRGLPPVHLWHPPHCGAIDMRIDRDGRWHYAGTPIGRPALVRLFSTILRRDPEGYVLVTPVERVGIAVEDVPFLAVEMDAAGEAEARTLRFRTNVDDWTEAGDAHPLHFKLGAAEGLEPYVHVRAGLWARLTRSLTVDLAEFGETRVVGGEERFGVTSAGRFFPMDRPDEAGPGGGG